VRFLGRAVNLAVSGLSEDVADIGVLIGFVCSLNENGGLVAHLTDLVALAPHPAAAPFPAAAVAASENPADPASWTAPFSLSNSAFSDLSDEDGFMGAYAALSLASGVAGITAERRGEPFSSSPGCSKMSLLASALALSARGHATPSALASASSLELAVVASHCGQRRLPGHDSRMSDIGPRASFFTGDANQRLHLFRSRSENLIASLPAFSAVAGSAKKVLAYDLAMQLALWIDPGADLSSLELWCRADRKLASYIAVLTLTINDPAAATSLGAPSL